MKLLRYIAIAACLLTPVYAHAQFAQQATWGGTAGGSANAQTITIANATALSNLRGVVLTYVPSATNTGATSLNINALGAQPVKKSTASGLAPLTGGEFVANDPAQVFWDGSEFVIVGPIASSGSGGGGNGANCNGVKFIYSFTTHGSYSLTVPASCTWLKVQVVGGGGGAAASNGSGQQVDVQNDDGNIGTFMINLGAAGGGAGGYAEAWYPVTPGQIINFSVGAGGPAVNVADNPVPTGLGGTTSFGYISATGGHGATVSSSSLMSTPGAGGAGAGGQINITGGAGGMGSADAEGGEPGVGGSSVFGNGGPGAGGSGGNGVAPFGGFPGNDGAVIISD